MDKIFVFLFTVFFRRAQQEGTEDDNPTTNGFVPIEQAIKNAEMKSIVTH